MSYGLINEYSLLLSLEITHLCHWRKPTIHSTFRWFLFQNLLYISYTIITWSSYHAFWPLWLLIYFSIIEARIFENPHMKGMAFILMISCHSRTSHCSVLLFDSPKSHFARGMGHCLGYSKFYKIYIYQWILIVTHDIVNFFSFCTIN